MFSRLKDILHLFLTGGLILAVSGKLTNTSAFTSYSLFVYFYRLAASV